MKQPLVVGVQHEDKLGGLLLDRYSQKLFEKNIFPIINRNTLLLLEGIYRKSLHRKWHPCYLYRRWEAQRFVGAPIGYPTIGWRDGRLCGQNAEQVSQIGRRFDEILTPLSFRVMPFVSLLQPIPTTWSELSSAFAHGLLEYEITEQLNEDELREPCSEMLTLHDQFDESTIASARAWKGESRHAIIVCGYGHALTIHRRTGWPMTCLIDETSENIISLAREMIAFILYPEKILGKTPVVQKIPA